MALQDWLEGVYGEHAAALFRFLLHLTGDEEETREALQEIFVRLAKEPRMLEGVAAPRSFLFRMAHRLVIDRHRRETARRTYDDRAQQEREPSAVPESPNDEAWMRQALAAAVESLPAEQKAVVMLKVWEGLTFAEIAEVLDIPANAAASRYRYALDKLRAGLRPLKQDLT